MEGEFQAWPKVPRLNRDIMVTEKIDGTNAAVAIAKTHAPHHMLGISHASEVLVNFFDDGDFAVIFAQSRKRIIHPSDDNFGFAAWVRDNALGLATALGHGRHFGEWWGSGIQRGYGLTGGEKRFSLFNVTKHGAWGVDLTKVEGLRTVPVLYEGAFSQPAILGCLDQLQECGSEAERHYMNPEGVIVFHTAAQHMFKVSLKDDEAPKSEHAAVAQHRRARERRAARA